MASRYVLQKDKFYRHYFFYGHSPPNISRFHRFTHSTLHQRDPRASSSLFDSYGGGSSERARHGSRSPAGKVGGYGFSGSPNGNPDRGASAGSYRVATPNSRYVWERDPFFSRASHSRHGVFNRMFVECIQWNSVTCANRIVYPEASIPMQCLTHSSHRTKWSLKACPRK